MRERLKEIRREATEAIRSGGGCRRELEELRVRYLGRKSELSSILRGLGKLSAEERPAVGKLANSVRREIETALREALAGTGGAAKRPALDVSQPGRVPPLGGVHVLTRTAREILEIFHGMGFAVLEGPDIETEFHNFEGLNFQPDHPARDAQDSFYLPGGFLLKTHTSPMQVRAMKAYPPPMAVVAPGRCYRRDATDASHTPVFHQIEGFLVDRIVTFAHLRGVLAEFCRRAFGRETKTRFRPDFFPFVEPGAEIAVSCIICGGKGCPTCRGSGWLEILGAGLVHPSVFRAVDIDPDRWQGFAFGMGVDRIAMLKYGINDIRLLFENDVRFLRQFEGGVS